MTAQTHRIAVPTKVMVAGEYAILEPGSSALAMAVHPGFEVTVRPAPRWTVELPDVDLFASVDHPAELLAEPLPLRLVGAALCAALDHWPGSAPVHIVLTGAPERLPVGASAALVAGTLLAVQENLAVGGPTPSLVPMGIEAHRRAQGSGSGYDVATILTGGMVRIDRGPSGDLGSRPLSSRPPWQLVVAVCGPDSPSALAVPKVWRAVAGTPELEDHRVASSALVDCLCLEQLSEGDLTRAVSVANDTLAALDQLAGGAILTPSVRNALSLGRPFPVRVSGAGGGDLVVGLVADNDTARQLRAQWTSAGLVARILSH